MPGVLLLRHALSVWNVEGRWQGQADPPLSTEGQAQARSAAARLGPFDLVVTSDLERSRHTGSLLAPGAPQVTEPLLREFDVGAWSGRTRAEIEREWAGELALFDAGRLDAPPGGERRGDFDERVGRAAARVASLVAGHGASRTLVVSHGGVVRALARLQGRGDHHVGHLCGYEAEVKEGALVVLDLVDLRSGAATTDGVGGRMAL